MAENTSAGQPDMDRTMKPGWKRELLAGRYRVVRQLGQGGMGSVWLAEDTKLDGHKVAIKMLPSILVNNKRAYAQLKKEALVSLNLSHPNIVTVRAFEEDNGNPFLVMDYIDGLTLDDYLAEKATLTEAETVRLLTPVAAALDHAHGQGIVHRDVKPGNVMIDKSGRPFVLDFGIAREIQETLTRVTGKLSSGTIMYMSPEQLHGDEPTSEQDVYSFAAMAYECLSGKTPFNRGQIEYQIEHDAPKPLPKGIAIARSVMAGLGKTPDERPNTCAAVLTADAGRTGDHFEEKAAGADDKVASADPEYDRIQAEIRKLEAVLARKKAEKRAAEEAEKEAELRARALCAAKERLAKLHQQVELESSGFKVGEVKVLELPGGAKMEMVYCPPGSFLMGSPESEKGRSEREKQHRVTLTQGFWMGKFAVTQAQWESVMGKTRKEKAFLGLFNREVDTNPSYFRGADRPVENVSWDNCQVFIQKINDATREKVALPTEAQWEYACRAGTTESFAGKLNDMAWYEDNSGGETHPVGQKAPNAWGLYDMHGNVWEWCADCYDSGFYATAAARVDPCCASGEFRVYRGGGWCNYARYCRSAYRGWDGSDNRYDGLGFRVCCSAGPRR